MTLKAVGQAMGVSHANLIHHFGSAAGLQGALMDRLVRDLAHSVDHGLPTATGEAFDPARLMAVVFEAFDAGGAAQLAAWLALEHETARAESFAGVVRDLADRTAALRGTDEETRARARAIVVIAAYMAFADALIGPALRPMLDMTPGDTQALALSAALGAAGPSQAD
ncbi:TetR/AcrR family transcriptional regulator [Brevundimonas diminuta]|uniref:TetR/AcrR family transcriptional regulator n=1 Tax=Brevundimonas diminuta TaxID=293 RepID=UPI003CC9AA98